VLCYDGDGLILVILFAVFGSFLFVKLFVFWWYFVDVIWLMEV
jgi:hypothetical protein